jgi:small-conductance mechanosensitive channel
MMQEILDELSKIIWPWVLKHGPTLVFIALGAFILNKLAKRIIRRVVVVAVVGDKNEPAEAEVKREETLIRIFTWVIRIVILVTSSLMILQEVGVPIGPILAGAGIIGLAVGFGAQYFIRDIITGFFMILENQYRIGDVVDFDGTVGEVEDISLRMTTLRDMNGTVHYVPHGDIKRVSNNAKNFAKINLDLGVGYSTNIEQLIEVINQVGNELAQAEYWKDLIIKAPQFLRVNDFGDSAIVVKIVGETQALKQWEVTGELRKRLKSAFDKAEIEIPFPQRVIHQAK